MEAVIRRLLLKYPVGPRRFSNLLARFFLPTESSNADNFLPKTHGTVEVLVPNYLYKLWFSVWGNVVDAPFRSCQLDNAQVSGDLNICSAIYLIFSIENNVARIDLFEPLPWSKWGVINDVCRQFREVFKRGKKNPLLAECAEQQSPQILSGDWQVSQLEVCNKDTGFLTAMTYPTSIDTSKADYPSVETGPALKDALVKLTDKEYLTKLVVKPAQKETVGERDRILVGGVPFSLTYIHVITRSCNPKIEFPSTCALKEWRGKDNEIKMVKLIFSLLPPLYKDVPITH